MSRAPRKRSPRSKAATPAPEAARRRLALPVAGAVTVVVLIAAGIAWTRRSSQASHAPDTPPAAQAAAAPAPRPDIRPPSTRRMAERLADVRAAREPHLNTFDNVARATRLKTMRDHPSFRPDARYYKTLANELLGAGEPEAARATMNAVLTVPTQDPALESWLVREFSALCDLRIGERDNCVHAHGVESCILPIQGDGIHGDQTGSRAAIAQYEDLLRERPANVGARWLLNIACMTVGEYPHGVMPGQLIPPEVFASEAEVGAFLDVAGPAGLQERTLAGGTILDDFDRDGLLDVVTTAMGIDMPMHLYRNEGDGSFTDRTEQAGLVGLVSGLNVVQTDYDNDGNLDIFVPRGAWLGEVGDVPNSLLRNRGDGTFEDVTEAAGLLTFAPSQVAVWADYDGDGWLDLFVGNESEPPHPHVSELWHNERNGTFTNRIGLLGAGDFGFVKGAAWGDYDNDGRPDLSINSLGGTRPFLFHNDGPRADGSWGFTDVTEKAGVTESKQHFSTWFFDYDNDGWLDLFKGGYEAMTVADVASLALGLPESNSLPILYRNDGDGTFSEVTRSAGLARVALVMGSNFGEVDNDGWLDMYLGTGGPDFRLLMPNRMFRNDGGKRFQDVTTAARVGHIQKGHSVSFGDVDNDGDQDIYTSMGGAFSTDFSHFALFRNPGNGNHWLNLRLEGRKANRAAIGARIRVRVTTPGGTRDVHSMVGSGSSFGGSTLRREIGLGDATAIESVEIRWPGSGTVDVLDGLELDRAYVVVEGEGATPAALPRFELEAPLPRGG